VDYLGTAEDNAALAAARDAIRAVFPDAVANSYSVKQASISDETAALAKINYVLDSLETNVSLTVTKIAWLAPTAGIGTEEEEDGTNGYYAFRVDLKKGAGQALVLTARRLNIIATPYDRTPDEAAIALARAAIEEAFAGLTVMQADLDSNDMEAAAAGIVDDILGGLASLASLSSHSITNADYEAPEAGRGVPGETAGVDGHYTVSINLSKVLSSENIQVGIAIAATPYDTAPDEAAIASAKAAIEAAFASIAFAQASVNTQQAAKAAAELAIAGMDLNGAAATVVNVSFNVAVAGTPDNQGGTNGSYGFKVTLEKAVSSTQTAEINIVIAATPCQDCTVPVIAKPSLAAGNIWLSVNGNAIQVHGISKAQTMRLLNANGKVVMSRIVTPNESVSIANLPNGIYMASIGGKTMRVAKR
jgi:hypothetical protein